MNRPVAALESVAPTRFRSVRRPHLGVLLRTDDHETSDVWVCERCDGDRELADGCHEYPCRSEDGGCDGYGWIHGFDSNLHGMPAEAIGGDDEEDRVAA